ncbi:MAG: HEAT repeat domain-containing protein [Myxococcales bacterium]|nr:HEAT repeat domain-containing protein [Myxococcales bacterium]
MKTFRWSFFVVVVLLLAAAVWSAWSPSRPQVVSSSPSTRSEVVEPLREAKSNEQRLSETTGVLSQAKTKPAVGIPSKRAARVGAQWLYDVSISRTLTLGADSEKQGDITLNVAGLLNLTVANVEEGMIHLHAVMDNVRFGGESSGGTQADPDVIRALEKAIEVPFFVTIDTTGRVEAVHFRTGTDEMARGLLKSVVTTGQMVLPTAAGISSWEVEETDSTGDYRARYQVDADGKRLQKTKLSYVRLATAAGLVDSGAGVMRMDTITFRGMYEPRSDGWPETINESEELTLASSSKLPALKTRGQARWSLVSTGNNPALVDTFQREWSLLETAELAKIEGVTATDKQHDLALVGGEPLAVMLGSLAALPADETADAERAGLMVRASAALRLEPKEATRVGAEIRNNAAAPHVGTLLGALGGANTPEAQQTLADLLKDTNLPAQVRADAAAHLGQSTLTDKAHVETLWDGVQDPDLDVHSQSLLALGASAQGLKTEHPEVAKSVTEKLMEYFATATTDEDRVLTLQALGNTGDAAMVPTLESAIVWPNEVVRAAAVMAFRFVQHPAAEPWITTVMVHDESNLVQKAAMAAGIFRPFSAMAMALEAVLKQDPAADVRHAALQTLAAQLPNAVVVLPAITWVAENDADEEIRLAAAQILEGAAGL